MFVLICINGCQVPGFGFNPFSGGSRPAFGGFPPRIVGNFVNHPRSFGPYGGAPYVIGPGAFVRSPFTSQPIGYFGFGGNARVGNLALPYGFQSVRGLTNYLGHAFNFTPFTNISDSLFGFTNNLESRLRNSISGTSYNIGDYLFGIANNLENNLRNSIVRSSQPTNIMDQINNFVSANLISHGIPPTGFAPVDFSSATNHTAYMITIQPINFDKLEELRANIISSA